MILRFLSQSFFLLAIFTGVPLAICAMAGFLVAFLQAVIQIQEQSIGLLVKIAVMGALIFYFR